MYSYVIPLQLQNNCDFKMTTVQMGTWMSTLDSLGVPQNSSTIDDMDVHFRSIMGRT